VKGEGRGREEKVGKRRGGSRGGKGCVMAVGGIDAPDFGNGNRNNNMGWE